MRKASSFEIFGTTFRMAGQGRGPEGFPVYQEQAQNQRGIHRPVSGCTNFPGGLGESEAGRLCVETWKGQPFGDLRDFGKSKHVAMLAEIRAMAKPNLKGI